MADADERRKELRVRGERLFARIVDRLNDLFPEGRTQEAGEQICVALELHYRAVTRAEEPPLFPETDWDAIEGAGEEAKDV